MLMSKPYRTLEEMAAIFGISKAKAQAIAKRYRVDSFTNRGKIYAHAKDFYTAYTKHFNPSLFDLEEKKKALQ